MSDHHDPRRTVELLFDSLRNLADGHTADGKRALRDGAVTVLDRLHRQVLTVVERDLVGTATPDGHRSRSGGGGRGGGPVVVVPDEHGDPDSVPVTSVELAVIALVDDNPTPDPLHDHVQAILGHLEVMVRAKHGLIARLAAIKASDRGVDVRTDPSGWCLVCDRFVEGTANDRLRRGMCRPDWVAWKRAGSPDITEFRRNRTKAATDVEDTARGVG